MNNGQHRFVKNKLCKMDQISFHDRVKNFVDKGEAVVVLYFDCGEAFVTG